MAESNDDNEVPTLTPKPISAKGWTQRRWALHYHEHAKALHARVVEVETAAGIRAKAERLEEGPLFPTMDLRPFNPKAHEAELALERERRRFGLRRLYFSVEDEIMRKRLIRLHRARDLASLQFHQAENMSEHHEFSTLEQCATPWARTSAIWTVAAIIIGAQIGHLGDGLYSLRQLVNGEGALIGAVAGAALGIIGAIKIRDSALQARAKSIADALGLLSKSDRIYQSILDEPETFTSWEEYAGRKEE